MDTPSLIHEISRAVIQGRISKERALELTGALAEVKFLSETNDEWDALLERARTSINN